MTVNPAPEQASTAKMAISINIVQHFNSSLPQLSRMNKKTESFFRRWPYSDILLTGYLLVKKGGNTEEILRPKMFCFL